MKALNVTKIFHQMSLGLMEGMRLDFDYKFPSFISVATQPITPLLQVVNFTGLSTSCNILINFIKFGHQIFRLVATCQLQPL